MTGWDGNCRLYWYGEIILGVCGDLLPFERRRNPSWTGFWFLERLWQEMSPVEKEALIFRYGFEGVSGRRSRK